MSATHQKVNTMYRLTLSIALAFSAPSLACDGSEPTPTPAQLREAPDVPWPSVTITGGMKSPLAIADVLASCFAEEVDYYSQPPSFGYGDAPPDGDDQQVAHLCVTWAAHLDIADCVREGLIDLGGAVSF